MRKKKIGAVVAAGKGLAGFFTDKEGGALRRDAAEAAAALGIAEIAPASAANLSLPPSHVNALRGGGGARPRRACRSARKRSP